jgi:hypothetical protein
MGATGATGGPDGPDTLNNKASSTCESHSDSLELLQTAAPGAGIKDPASGNAVIWGAVEGIIGGNSLPGFLAASLHPPSVCLFDCREE